MDVRSLEHDLRTYRPAGMTALPEPFVWPRYEGFSVGNLPATIASALGGELSDALPPLHPDLLDGLTEGVRRVVTVLLDGMGWEQLRWAMQRDPKLVLGKLGERGRLLPLTTVFPSTTCNVLATLRTGAAPVQHGLLAYEMFLREWQMGVECITFSPSAHHVPGQLGEWGMDTKTFLPVPSFAQQLAARGIPTDAVIASHLKHGPLTRIYFRGVRRLYGHAYASDFWAALRDALQAHRGERFYLSGYWGAIDGLSHLHGPLHETVYSEMRTLGILLQSTFLDALEPEDREGTLLLILADHGQIAVPADQAIILDTHPVLRDALILPPLGEARAPFFYVRAGHLAEVQAYLEDTFDEQMVCLSQDDVIESGLLGPGSPYAEVRHRLGDLVGLLRGGGVLVRDPGILGILHGRHGGLMPQEMLIPLIALRLDA